jgi:hypothetical protein
MAHLWTDYTSLNLLVRQSLEIVKCTLLRLHIGFHDLRRMTFVKAYVFGLFVFEYCEHLDEKSDERHGDYK